MKAMISAFAAMILIALAAWIVLDQSGFSTADQTSGPAVRLD